MIAEFAVVSNFIISPSTTKLLKASRSFYLVVVVNLGLLDVYKYNRTVKAVIPWPSVEVKAVARALVL